MENKKSKGLIVLLVIFIILTLVLAGYILYDKFISKNNIDNSNNKINENQNNNNSEDLYNNINGNEDDIYPIISNNIIYPGEMRNVDLIENLEVKGLYNYVQPSLKSNAVTLGYFYQNPFKNHSLNDKISLVLINYGSNYEKEIDEEFLQNFSGSDKEFVEVNCTHYIDADIIRQGMKLIFNITINDFSEEASYFYKYESDADAFVNLSGGGNYLANAIQQIIDYTEANDEITLTVVKAESDDSDIYRYINNNSLVFTNISQADFKFSKGNVDKFPQLKYIFKKNESGHYYVDDIINLNFEQDFEKID